MEHRLREEIICGIYFCDSVPKKCRVLRNKFLRLKRTSQMLRNLYLLSKDSNYYFSKNIPPGNHSEKDYRDEKFEILRMTNLEKIVRK